MSCPYKNIFGIPEKGFHSTRLFGFAMYDTLGTIFLAFLITYFFGVSLWKSILGMFIIGEALHYLFCVDTAFIKLFKA